MVAVYYIKAKTINLSEADRLTEVKTPSEQRRVWLVFLNNKNNRDTPNGH
jgi:hypothetical protein